MYLGNVDASLPADDFVAALDSFIDSVIARLRDRGLEKTPLQELWALVRKERREPSTSEFRRLEALLGFDAEEGPHSRIEALIEAGKRLGSEAIAEVAAISKEVPDLSDIEEALQEADRVAVQDCASLRKHVAGTAGYRYSWQRGEEAGRIVRSVIGQANGPLDDSILEDWLSLPTNVLQQDPTTSRDFPFAAALRGSADSDEMRVLFRSSFHSGRRFEIARLVGDHLVSAPRDDRMMPATQAKTARQSTQRAFAAELLLPWSDLIGQIGDNPDDEERIEDIAFKYQVSPLVVRTRLVSKGISEHSL
ncbi:ImmA/IrrE family metallo-endopeptidase [Persicimonas caeni]|uniref:ImmA/IrrE family metallo-endopeptidase n=1 Tax=Persicimonas caeni TaxID=2292766 RepID=A0A4Y6PV07_PERCE|nr:ImmA/IrrE family metallo-endopeptidase [Persicimonas caeni]QDG52083.1 ImmA/IrrE family metallo-endopeptidase [Persicimonas caeni]QED33304.1 ImmA/IrrE family metallo-endopeptidase [Persicimonas caeni]